MARDAADWLILLPPQQSYQRRIKLEHTTNYRFERLWSMVPSFVMNTGVDVMQFLQELIY
jgi:hypothetical protein